MDELEQGIAKELNEIKEKVKGATVVTIRGSEVALVNKELNIEVKMNAYTAAKYNQELALSVSDFILAEVVNSMLQKAGISVVSKDVYLMQ